MIDPVTCLLGTTLLCLLVIALIIVTLLQLLYQRNKYKEFKERIDALNKRAGRLKHRLHHAFIKNN